MKRVALLSFSPLRYDSRILRHATIISGAGYEVRIFAQGPLPDIVPCPVTKLPGPGSDWRVRTGIFLRQAPATIWPQTAKLLYWLSRTKLIARNKLRQFKPDIIIANDWNTLPIALSVKKHCNAKIIYDSHEFASEEFADSLRWRILAQRYVSYIEKLYIPYASKIMTVSDGISNSLHNLYSLNERPTVIYNMPTRQNTIFRQSKDEIVVLYHGAIAPRRGLENLIKSVKLWPQRFRLEIRGPIQGQFDQYLKIIASPLGNRVSFLPAVASRELISSASQADIGIFLFSSSTTHAKFALPNKIFEYIQAGLMIISSDLPEIRSLFDKYKCGILIPDNDPSSIASALSSLRLDTIDEFKRNSVNSSRSLNFEREMEKLINLIRESENHCLKLTCLDE